MSRGDGGKEKLFYWDESSGRTRLREGRSHMLCRFRGKRKRRAQSQNEAQTIGENNLIANSVLDP